MGGQFLEGIKTFYTGANACVRVERDFTEFLYRSGCKTGMCDVTLAI